MGEWAGKAMGLAHRPNACACMGCPTGDFHVWSLQQLLEEDLHPDGERVTEPQRPLGSSRRSWATVDWDLRLMFLTGGATEYKCGSVNSEVMRQRASVEEGGGTGAEWTGHLVFLGDTASFIQCYLVRQPLSFKPNEGFPGISTSEENKEMNLNFAVDFL